MHPNLPPHACAYLDSWDASLLRIACIWSHTPGSGSRPETMIDKQRSSFIRRIVASQPSIWLSFIYSQAIIWIISGNFQTQIRTLQDGLTLLKMARSKFSKSSTSSSFSEGESHCACSTLLPAVSPMWWVGTYLNGFIFLPSKRDIEGAALKFKCFLDLVTYSLIAGALITNMG